MKAFIYRLPGLCLFITIMFKKIKSHLGLKLFILLTVVIILSVLPLSYTALQDIKRYGREAAEVTELQIRSQALFYLREITRERADKYQAFFDRIATLAGILGHKAAIIYSDLAYYSQRPLEDYRFNVLPQNGFWGNSIDDPVVSLYWGAPELSSDIKQELSALTHMTPLFQWTLDENPEVLASHLITVSGIGQYCTNNLQNKEIAFNLPPISVFDLRDGEPMRIFTKGEDISPEVRWTNIYKDDVIEGLMLTASASIYDNGGVFRGVTGVDVPLNTVIEDILQSGKEPSGDLILFSFLLDSDRKLIAFPETYYPLFGISVDRSQLINSGDRLDVSLADSTLSEVRNLAQDLSGKDVFFTKLHHGTDTYYVVTSKIEKLDWILGVVVRENDMLASVQKSRAAMNDTVISIGLKGVVISSLIVLVAIIIAFWAVKYLVMPLRTIAVATQRVAGGDLSVVCPVTTTDEAGVLAASFNTMVERLQMAKEQQERYADSLELEVERRNIELGNKKGELEVTIELLTKEVERRQIVAEALRNSQQQYYDTLEAYKAGVYIIEDGLFTYVNSSLAELFQFAQEELFGLNPLDLICLEDRQLAAKNMLHRLQRVDIPPYTLKCVRKDGSTFYGELWSKIATWQKNPVIVGTITDVSNVKINEERLKIQDRQLQKSLDEKEVLLKEIYHRTKNNMLVIISMLDLQIQDIEDEQVKTIFLETENRIRAMALVHEKLYQSQNLSEIDLGSYLHEIVESLVNTMALDGRIVLLSNVEPVPINIDYAVPLGLVINELVTNSVKHAFPDNRSGSVYLTVEKNREGEILLAIGDDGIGLPEDIDVQNSTSFGMQIVTSLVKVQLKGSITVNRDNGTRYLISLPEPRTTKRI